MVASLGIYQMCRRGIAAAVPLLTSLTLSALRRYGYSRRTDIRCHRGERADSHFLVRLHDKQSGRQALARGLSARLCGVDDVVSGVPRASSSPSPTTPGRW